MLAGRTVVVTRPQVQSGHLVRQLEALGARAIVAPAVRILPPDDVALDRAVDGLLTGRFRWLVLTSANGVQALFRRLGEHGLRTAADLGVPIAAIGPGTRLALATLGAEPTLMPDSFTTEALGAAMPNGSGEVLLARADIAPRDLENALVAKGWTPVRVDAYRTELADAMPADLATAFEAGEVDAVTFTSASTVRGFLHMAGADGRRVLSAAARPAVVCIGPVTAREAETTGIPVDAVADPHTIEGLVAALERVLGPRPT
jgi:uroporphyrinogen-III synthase